MSGGAPPQATGPGQPAAAPRDHPERPLQFKERALVALSAGLLRLLHFSTRYSFEGLEAYERTVSTRRPLLVAFWHEDLVNVLLCHSHLNFGEGVVLISRSRDGELLARLIETFGLETVRASSSSGAVRAIIALRRYLLRPSETRRAVAIALDGPRGPRRVAKPGAAAVARGAGARILPVTFAPSREWRFKSWDRTRVIKPFSQLQCTFYEPIDATLWPDDASLTAELERILGPHPPDPSQVP